SRSDIEDMINETKVSKIINGARGLKYDKEALIETLSKVAKMINENPNIEELDINPFFLYEEGKGGIGVDALIKLS
ncbi:MAG TPA: acetate--CoA ligase family protein, partial [Anaerovoracaceae bacterium]|nr:acetate--CoA ligase family protein [Anaerovoracaceae bacterium]